MDSLLNYIKVYWWTPLPTVEKAEIIVSKNKPSPSKSDVR